MKTSSLCIVAVMVTTFITFSQTPENAPAEVAWVIKPLELPADNVELVSPDGRKITAIVLSKDDKGITIRNADGKEIFIEFAKLSPVTFEKINGKKLVAPPVLTGGAAYIAHVANIEKHKARVEALVEVEKNLKMLKSDLIQAESSTPQTETEVKSKKLKIEVLTMKIQEAELLRVSTDKAIIAANDEERNKSLIEVLPRSLKMAKSDLIQAESSTPQTETEVKIKKLKIEVVTMGIQQTELLLAAENPYAQRTAWLTDGSKMSIKEIQERVVNSPNTDIIHRQVNIKSISLFMKYNGLEKDPNWEKFNLTPLDLLPKLEIKPVGEVETVSLQARCKELGVTPIKQIGETCALYATQHLLQYACLSAGMKPPSIDALRKAYKEPLIMGRYAGAWVWDTIPEVVGKRPITQWIGVSNQSRNSHVGPFNLGKPMSHEMAKQEIRDGRPVLAGDRAHIVVLVGFETFKTGKTRWTYLNSNGLDRNGGYHTIQEEAVTPMYSIRFE